jgi:Flp pilus assembly protein protease CpaA
MPAFFPHELFAGVFAVLLLAGLGLASWFDLQTLIVPKKVTLSLAGMGLLLNLIRGIWLGAMGQSVWLMGAGVASGGFDGLLFGLLGFLTGFGIFFVLWILNVAGGGDVKLAAAIGSWVGPVYFLGVLALALPVVILFTLVRMALAMTMPSSGLATNKKWRLLSYSLPLTIAVLILLVMGFTNFKILPS